MEVIITLVRLVYHDASSIGLELEVADAVKFYVQARRFGFFFLLSIHAQTSLMAQITDTIRHRSCR